VALVKEVYYYYYYYYHHHHHHRRRRRHHHHHHHHHVVNMSEEGTSTGIQEPNYGRRFAGLFLYVVT
jgi:hypothetical protein